MDMEWWQSKVSNDEKSATKTALPVKLGLQAGGDTSTLTSYLEFFWSWSLVA